MDLPPSVVLNVPRTCDGEHRVAFDEGGEHQKTDIAFGRTSPGRHVDFRIEAD